MVLRPGETPQDALTRVILHERVGHDGLKALLGAKDGQGRELWEKLKAFIPPAELEAIANNPAYCRLRGDPDALAQEWFARKAESSPHPLEKPGPLRDLWNHFKGLLQNLRAPRNGGTAPQLDQQLRDLLRQARKAALHPPEQSASERGTDGGTIPEGSNMFDGEDLVFSQPQDSSDSPAQPDAPSRSPTSPARQQSTPALHDNSRRPGAASQSPAQGGASITGEGAFSPKPGTLRAGEALNLQEFKPEHARQITDAMQTFEDAWGISFPTATKKPVRKQAKGGLYVPGGDAIYVGIDDPANNAVHEVAHWLHDRLTKFGFEQDHRWKPTKQYLEKFPLSTNPEIKKKQIERHEAITELWKAIENTDSH